MSKGSPRNCIIKNAIENNIWWRTNAKRLIHTVLVCDFPYIYPILCLFPFSKLEKETNFKRFFIKLAVQLLTWSTTQTPSHHSWLFSGLRAFYVFFPMYCCNTLLVWFYSNKSHISYSPLCPYFRMVPFIPLQSSVFWQHPIKTCYFMTASLLFVVSMIA